MNISDKDIIDIFLYFFLSHSYNSLESISNKSISFKSINFKGFISNFSYIILSSHIFLKSFSEILSEVSIIRKYPFINNSIYKGIYLMKSLVFSIPGSYHFKSIIISNSIYSSLSKSIPNLIR